MAELRPLVEIKNVNCSFLVILTSVLHNVRPLDF